MRPVPHCRSQPEDPGCVRKKAFATDFVNLIGVSCGFPASTEAVTTSDNLLRQTINMRR